MDKHEFISIQKKLRIGNQRTAEILGLRLTTVQTYADGKKEIPQIVNNFLHFLQFTKVASSHILIADQELKRFM